MANKKTKSNQQIKKVISYILVILIFFSFLGVVFFHASKAKVFNPEFYKESLVEANTYQRLINDGVPSVILTTNTQEDNLADFLTRKAIVYLLKKLVTPEWLRNETEVVVDRFFVFLSTPGEQEKILNFLDNFRETYLTNASQQLAVIERSIPKCEGDIITVFFPNVDCAKVNESLDQIRQVLNESQTEVAALEAQLTDMTNRVESYVKVTYALSGFIQKTPTYFWLSLVLTLLFVAGLILLRYKNIPSILKWVSTPFILAAGFVLILAYVIHWTVGVYFDSLILKTTPEMRSILVDIMTTTANNLFGYIKIFAWITFVIALIILISGFVIERVDWRKVARKVKKKK